MRNSDRFLIFICGWVLLSFSGCLNGPTTKSQPKVADKIVVEPSADPKANKKPSTEVDLFASIQAVPTSCDVQEYSALKGHVNTCVAFVENHPAGINFFDTKKCINTIGKRFNELLDQDCKNALGATIEESYQRILDGFLVGVIATGQGVFNWDNGLDPTDPNYEAHVEDYFSLVGAWYRQVTNKLYPLAVDEKILSAAQNQFVETHIFSKFWDELEAHSPEWACTFGEVAGPTGLDCPETGELFQIFETILTLNEKVLSAVARSELAADLYQWDVADSQLSASPVLAGFIGDTLAPFFERVRTLTKVYDIACKLQSCNDSFYTFNETIWMLNFFDQVAQTAQIENFQFDDDDVRPLTLFLKSIYKNRAVINKLSAKLSSTFGVADIASVAPGTDFPFFLESFRKVFAESHDLVANYEATKSTSADGVEKAGFFHGGNISQVNVGFGEVNMNQHISTVTGVNQELRSLSDSFDSLRNELINNTLSINSTSIALNQLEDKINIDVTNMVSLKGQIDAIRSFVSDQKDGFANKVRQVLLDLGSSTETFTQVGGTVNLSIDASSSNQGSGDFTSIGKTEIVFPDTLQKGDLVQISVSGEYQPTCALTDSGYGSNVSAARTGSRGYSLVFADGESKVSSTNNFETDSTYQDFGISSSQCAGTPEVIGTTIGFTSQNCLNFSMGSRNSRGTTTSDQSSQSSRSEASFDLGLTLPNTPYPTAPVGSLLLVEMENLQNNKWVFRSQRVLNNTTSVIAEYGAAESTKYYLIVNDCYNPSGVGSLNVTINQYRAAGTLANDFVTKVTAMMPLLEQEVSDLVDNGVLSQNTLGVLRSTLAGTAAGGISLDSFSGNIRQILQAFLDSEISLLDYKSQISNLERELENRKLQLESLVDHFGDETGQKRLKVSQRNWNLANMDLDFVNQEGTNRNLYTLNRVLQILDQSLVSYLDFRFNEEKKRAIVGDVGLLTRLNFASPFDDIALNITTFMTTLLDNLKDDLENRPYTPKMMMGFHIPNPYYQNTIGLPDPVYDFPVLDDFRAKQFWDEIYAWKRGKDGAAISFELMYEDLYQPLGLACYVEAPIIDSFGMYFIPENEGYITDFNNMFRHRNAKMELQGLSHIPFENNPRRYNFTNSDWRFMDSAVRMAKSSRDAFQRLSNEFPPNSVVETGLGTGRSPFGQFEIGDIPAYRYNSTTDEVLMGETPLDEIRELFVGYTFAASSNDFRVNMEWMEFCAPGGQYWQSPFYHTPSPLVSSR